MAEVEIRPARPDDVEGAFDVLDACQREAGEIDWTLEHLRNFWRIERPRWAAEENGAIVGFAELGREGFDLFVHPRARGRGIGTRLLAAVEAAAGREVLRGGTHSAVPEGARFLVSRGFVKAWDVWKMGIDLTGSLAPPRWPEDVIVRTFRDDDAGEVKELLDLAYAEEPFHVPATFKDWRQAMLGDPSFEPTCWFLAEADAEIVAVALNWREGFVKDLVVHPQHRRRGLGEALMRHTFREFRRRGLDRVTLKTDSTNPTQAWRLYERLGMKIDVAYGIYEKRL